MRLVSIIGHKNSGKTTLLVALAREFKRQGKRVASIKHASHPATVDREGTDSYRHFYEGCTERTLIASPDTRILFERAPDNIGPRELAEGWLDGEDIVLVEGFKKSDLPKIEVYRSASGFAPLYDPKAPNASQWVAIVTDDPSFRAECRVLRFQDTMWLPVLAALAWERAGDASQAGD